MADNAPFGFRPTRHKTGGQIHTTRYVVTASGNAAGIAIGDAVRRNPNGVGVIKVSGDVVPTTQVLGAVVALYDSNNRPQTFSQPTRGPALPASTAGYADVVDDPHVVFVVQSDATALPSHIGQYVSLTAANTYNTAAGTSNMAVRIATVDTSVRQCQIVGFFGGDKDNLGAVAGIPAASTNVATPLLEVVFSRHIFTGSV